MKEKVLKLLVKRGNKQEDSQKMIDNNLQIALKMYPDAKPAKIAEVLTYL